jgi:hypothetical protein
LIRKAELPILEFKPPVDFDIYQNTELFNLVLDRVNTDHNSKIIILQTKLKGMTEMVSMVKGLASEAINSSAAINMVNTNSAIAETNITLPVADQDKFWDVIKCFINIDDESLNDDEKEIKDAALDYLKSAYREVTQQNGGAKSFLVDLFTRVYRGIVGSAKFAQALIVLKNFLVSIGIWKLIF